ncbi:MAG: hypothetical protein ACPL0F_05860 [bacterium]|jgi:hypothetical protein
MKMGTMQLLGLIFLLRGVIPPSDSLVTDTLLPKFKLVADGPVRVSARIVRAPPVLTLGDRVKLQIQVRHPRELAVSPPVPANPDELVVIDQQHRIEYQGDTVVEVYDLTLAVFTIGEQKLAPWLVYYQDQGEACAAGSDSIPLRVKSLISERMQDIHDLKPQVSFPNLVPLWILLGLAGAGLAGFWGWRWWQRRRRQAEALPLLPPWDEALQALDALPVSEWLAQRQIKRLYYTVSEIVKRYLTRRFGFPAVDQTTTEIIRELKRRRIAEGERFATFFLDADLVKYAKYVPVNPVAVCDDARELVRLTMPQPEPGITGGAGQTGGG